MKAQYRCRGSEARLQAVRDSAAFNGIDYLEVTPSIVDPVGVAFVDVHFQKKPTGLAKLNFVIEGGERIRPIKIFTFADSDPTDDMIRLETTNGDFSTYTLRLVSAIGDELPPPFYDPQLAAVDFSFKIECPSDFDCKPGCACHPEAAVEPEIDYLAKDYATFRRLMLDRLTLLAPGWRERNPADAGIALVEMLAYAADQLSYEQDAVATEAYLGTARRRVSVRRHARLVDYPIHDGCNARTWVQLRVRNDLRKPTPAFGPIIPKATPLLTRTSEFKVVISPADLPPHLDGEVFETMHALDELYLLHNDMPLYTWSATECCLPKGAMRATLAGHFPDLKPGHVVVFKEILGAESGVAVDADPSHIHPVRLTRADAWKPLGLSKLTDPVTGTEITELGWSASDALPFPLCVSAHFDAGDRNVSVVLGNIVLADHGRSTGNGELLPLVPEPNPALALVGAASGCGHPERKQAPLRFTPTLQHDPLTFAASIDTAASASSAMTWSMRDVSPSIGLLDSDGNHWLPRRDLLASDNLAREFVVEPEDDQTRLRFGDDRQGRRPDAGMQLTAFYRVGNGRRGNIGGDAIAHIIIDQPPGLPADIRTT
ncbi:MAG: uncharacterized protein JWO56_2027, partial [Acidobacteria bacterium]|nr:uncharacterized protein [Acidobacteriota bacterium]